MRIGIFTFPNSSSLGASLQMYALYKEIERLGHKSEIINYNTPNWLGRLNKSKPTLNEYVCLSAVKIISLLFIKDSKKSIDRFESRFLFKYPPKTILKPDELQELSDRYDRIIVGSDQVWNPMVNGNDKSFFLSFCKHSYKKAAYAPSFGVTSIEENEKDEIAALLNDFTYLSAREKQGVELIRTITGKEVPLVLDPTFLIKKEEWETLAIYPQKNYGNYILFYTIKPSPVLYQFAQSFADKHGLKLVTIGGHIRDIFDKKKLSVFGVGPTELIGLISGSAYVATNSFHGTAFSINLHKNFYVEYSTDTNSRLVNIINTFELYDCIVKEDTITKEAISINYDAVDVILEQEKNRSMQYLMGVVKE